MNLNELSQLNTDCRILADHAAAKRRLYGPLAECVKIERVLDGCLALIGEQLDRLEQPAVAVQMVQRVTTIVETDLQIVTA